MHSNNNISPIFKCSIPSKNSTKMGKKKNQSFPFKSSIISQTPSSSSSSSSWSWPSACTTPKTLSFRAPPQDIFKTMNSTFLNPNEFADTAAPESIFLEEEEEEDSTEAVIRGLKSEERLVFEPGETSSSILEGNKNNVNLEHENNDFFKESSTTTLATSVESTNPFADFKKSMEEMVEAHELKDWDCLEELLTCYLKVNCRSNHGYIIGAFVELLVSLGFVASSSSSTTSNSSSTTTSSNSFSSPLSYPSSTNSSNISPCLSSLEEVDIHDDVEKPPNNVVVSL